MIRKHIKDAQIMSLGNYKVSSQTYTSELQLKKRHLFIIYNL
jgi:hypothetical protein